MRRWPIAEQFGMLEAFHPGRIDLGIGRAPGTDQLTAAALRRHGRISADGFPENLGDLIAFFHGTFPDDHPYSRITAVPARDNVPDLWLLGSSGYSAQVAGMLGLPFAFAHHFSPATRCQRWRCTARASGPRRISRSRTCWWRSRSYAPTPTTKPHASPRPARCPS